MNKATITALQIFGRKNEHRYFILIRFLYTLLDSHLIFVIFEKPKFK